MKSKFYILVRSLTLFSVLLGFVFLISCEDENADTSLIELYSFGPSGVRHGEMIQFIGVNLDKVTAIVFANGTEVSAGEFQTKTSKRIEIMIPEAAESGKVTLKTPQGDIVSKSTINFEVPVKINTITAEAKPGTNITISGEFINWIESVTFTSDLLVEQEDFVSQSQTELVVTVPMEAQSGFLIFASGGTEPMTFSSEEELVVKLPVVSSMGPLDIKHTDNLTLSGTDLDLVTSIIFAGDFEVSDYISQSETELVVQVPVGTLDGTLTLNVHSPLQVVTSESITIILPAGTNVSPVPAVPGTDNITITGTNLDLVAELTLPGVDMPLTGFVSQTATEIVVAVPEGAKNGSIGYTTIHGYSENLGVLLIIPGEGPPPLLIEMYDETVNFGGGDWSWSGDVSDPSNTEQFYSGNVSWKFTTTAGGGASAGGMTGINASSTEVFAFSLFGGPGTDGAQVAAILGSDGSDKWDSYNSVTLVEGEWTEYEIDLANYPTVNLTNVTRWIFKVEGITSSTIYVDRVGFDMGGPKPLAIDLYNEAVNFGGGDWSWSADESDPASTEQAYMGDVSWKFYTAADGGVSAGGMTGVDASAMSVFSFALFGGPGTDGAQVAAVLGSDDADKWDSYNSVTIKEGEWTEYSIDLSSYPTVNFGNVTRWILKVEGITGTTIYVDRVGFD